MCGIFACHRFVVTGITKGCLIDETIVIQRSKSLNQPHFALPKRKLSLFSSLYSAESPSGLVTVGLIGVCFPHAFEVALVLKSPKVETIYRTIQVCQRSVYNDLMINSIQFSHMND